MQAVFIFSLFANAPALTAMKKNRVREGFAPDGQ
jgi:hypothetical protein